MSKTILYHSAIEVLSDKALFWFRANKSIFRNWIELRDGLRTQFLPRNYNEQLWQQIKTRTQGEDESVGIYVAFIKNLFGRMKCEVSDEMSLAIIKKNLHPKYRPYLVSEDVSTEAQLIDLGRRAEESLWTEDYSPPNRMKKGVESDLAYVCSEGKSLRINEVAQGDLGDRMERPDRVREDSAHYPRVDKNKVKRSDPSSSRGGSYNQSLADRIECYRCHRRGHIARNCMTQILKCFDCGGIGHVKSKCPGNERRDR